MKKTARPRSGSLPRIRKRMVPMTTVTASAISGEAIDIARDGSGRTSSFSMARRGFAVPEAAHPLADSLDRRLGRRHARRDPALGDHDEAITDLEQLVELLADDEDGAAGVAQGEQLAADLRCRADVDTPGRLRDDEQLRPGVDLAPDDELLQVAARQALGRRARAAGLDVEAADQRLASAVTSPTRIQPPAPTAR